MNPLPRSYTVKALRDYVGPSDEECSLCPVQALRYYLEKLKYVLLWPRTLYE